MNAIRIIHNLPRSGGTIINKAISAQKDIVLLSEIHPNGHEIRKAMQSETKLADPLLQFQEWYNYFAEDDFEKILKSKPSFLDKIKIINQKVIEKNKILIIRDWSFVDYLSIPYFKPSYKNSLLKILSHNFNFINLYIIRNPLETFLSCMRRIPNFSNNYTFNLFLEAYEHFILNISKNNFIRYENFVEDPKKSLIQISMILKIHSEGLLNLKSRKINITGDDNAINSDEINKKNLSESLLNNDQLDKIKNNLKFQKIMKKLNEYSN